MRLYANTHPRARLSRRIGFSVGREIRDHAAQFLSASARIRRNSQTPNHEACTPALALPQSATAEDTL
jgi:hypothetical protein